MGFITKAFGLGGSAPTPPPAPPPAPAISDETVTKAAEDERRRRSGRGRASTVLTGLGGLDEEESKSARKVLLGAGA